VRILIIGNCRSNNAALNGIRVFPRVFLQCVVSDRQGGLLSLVLFAFYVNNLTLKLLDGNLGCRICGMSICCLFDTDDTVLLNS